MDPIKPLMVFSSRWYNETRADQERIEEMETELTDEVLKMAQTIDNSMKQMGKLLNIVGDMSKTIDVLQKSNESLHESIKLQQEVIDKLVHARLAQGKQQPQKPQQRGQSKADLAYELAAREYLWSKAPFLAWFLGPK